MSAVPVHGGPGLRCGTTLFTVLDYRSVILLLHYLLCYGGGR